MSPWPTGTRIPVPACGATESLASSVCAGEEAQRPTSAIPAALGIETVRGSLVCPGSGQSPAVGHVWRVCPVPKPPGHTAPGPSGSRRRRCWRASRWVACLRACAGGGPATNAGSAVSGPSPPLLVGAGDARRPQANERICRDQVSCSPAGGWNTEQDGGVCRVGPLPAPVRACLVADAAGPVLPR